MTILQLVGAIGIAYGPASALFILTIATQPLRIIVMMSGMFFWLLSLLLSSLWWTIIPLKDKLAFGLTFSILFQEIFRFALYKLLSKAEAGLQTFAQTEEERREANGSVAENKKHEYAYVAGLGFGTMSGLFALINVLDDSRGPGTVGLREGDSLNYLITSAFFVMLMVLLHVVWNIVFYWGLNTRRFYAPIMVVLSHFMVSELTLLKGEYLHMVALPVAVINLVIMSVLAFIAVDGSIQNIISACSCKRRQYQL